MASQADVAKYEELMQELLNFYKTILASKENMEKYADACRDIMGNDSISANAVPIVKKECKKYLGVASATQDLRKKLAREREAIIRLIQQSKNLGGN